MADVYDLANEGRASAYGAAIAKSKLGRHPIFDLMQAEANGMTKDQFLTFADLRYNAASHFEKLLEHAWKLADQTEGMKEVTEELRHNLDDERGTGRSTGEDAHSQWRKDFLDAIGIEVKEQNHIPLYAFDKDADDLPTLLGLILGAEITIPREDKPMLAAFKRLFPEHASDPVKSRYLEDHIHHDARKHFPDLIGAVRECIKEPEDIMKVVKGIERFGSERVNLYENIMSELALTAEQQALVSAASQSRA